MYTVREFRDNIKEALDKCTHGETIHIKRNGTVYTLSLLEEHTAASQSSKIREMPKSEPKLASGGTTYIVRYGCGCKKVDKLLCSKHGRY